MEFIQNTFNLDRASAVKLLVTFLFSTIVFGAWLIYGILYLVAPIPRPPLPLEKKYRTVESDGNISTFEDLPCWYDRHDWQGSRQPTIEKAEVFVSLVVPAYNEQERLGIMLKEAVDYLREYDTKAGMINGHVEPRPRWEVLIISDGSTDQTIQTALSFAKELPPEIGGCIRVVQLVENRGKGGAVIQGMKHVRGEYVVFADADGASKFEDLDKLVRRCRDIQDSKGRGVAVGSRAHLVGSDAVVKRSFLRNLLMHSFHLFLRLMTPKKTAQIKDTQCGFKLFSRPSLPYIIPYMHSEGWIFDVEMLMLAESAGIPVVEVPIGWKEVKGSKLNVVWDSLGMAWGLFVLRAAWQLGIYTQ